MTTRKPPTRTAKVVKFAKARNLHHTLPALAVFGVAAYQSYWHTVEVVARAGEGGHGVAHIMAISVDGLMIVASRYITASKTRSGKVLSAVGFVLGMLATLGSNLAAADANPLSRAVAVWPAVALIATACILHWGNRPAKRSATRSAAKVTNTAKIRSIA
jgi:hypothetical protein